MTVFLGGKWRPHPNNVFFRGLLCYAILTALNIGDHKSKGIRDRGWIIGGCFVALMRFEGDGDADDTICQMKE